MLRNTVKDKDEQFSLDMPSEDEMIGSIGGKMAGNRNLKYHKMPLTEVQLLGKIYGALWWIAAILILILGLLVAQLVTAIVLVSVGTSTEQFKRSVMVVDKVFDLHDYTKTMVDMSTGAQVEMGKITEEYDFKGMLTTVKNTLGVIQSAAKPETMQQVSGFVSQATDALHNLDFVQVKQLITRVTNLVGAVEPQQITDLLHKGSSFVEEANNALLKAQEENLIHHIGTAAVGATALEARLQRLNEITIKLPEADSHGHPVLSMEKKN